MVRWSSSTSATNGTGPALWQGRGVGGDVGLQGQDAGIHRWYSETGYFLVRACLERGAPRRGAARPSSRGHGTGGVRLPGERWRFVGVSRGSGGLGAGLGRGRGHTTWPSSRPGRLAATLSVLAGSDPGRPAAVCRELTKLHEEVRHRERGELAAYLQAEPAPRRDRGCRGRAFAGRRRPGEPGCLPALQALVRRGRQAHPTASARREANGFERPTNSTARWRD